MPTTDSGPLVEWYENRVGTSSTADEARGYWVFVLGVLTGVLGIALVLLSDVESVERGVGSMFAAVALLLLLIGPVLRLPLRRAATLLLYLGAVLCLLAVAWFYVAYPADFGAQFDGQEIEIIALYGLGVLAIAAGGIFTPLLVSPREEQEAAEARAAEAERERDAATAEASRAAEERAERDAIELELQRIEDSQSQFELYTDNGDKHRWRLRHRNRNVIADSSQGYSSRQKAQQGLSAVKRDVVGAGVVDLDKTDHIEVTEVNESVDGEDAPSFVEAAESKATFETYEDNEGRYRWRLVHDNGNIIAASGKGYASSNARDTAIERVSHYVQSADYLELDPSAFELYRDSAEQYRWRLLHKNGNILADSGQGYTSRQNARQGIDSVRQNVGEGGEASFEVYEDAAGNYRWRLVHDNGNIIADGGEGYPSETGARDAVVRIREYAPEAYVLDTGSAAFEIYEDNAGGWRWQLRHRNGTLMANGGEGYTSRTAAEAGIHSVKHNGPNAGVE